MPVQTYRITMRSGPTPGKSFPLESEEMFLGRDLSNAIAIPDPEVSRRHARFVVRPEGVMIEDQGSTNGTFINGVRLSVPQALKNGDVITFGESIVVVFEALAFDPDATVVAGQTHLASEHMQKLEPEVPSWPVPPPARPVQPVVQPRPVQAPVVAAPVSPSPAPYLPVQPVYPTQEPVAQKKKKFPTWLLILLLLAILACVVVSVILIFMPASWWCALTFNSLPGCPIY
jgi:hypothetical protein